jgi:hypothetical protein
MNLRNIIILIIIIIFLIKYVNDEYFIKKIKEKLTKTNSNIMKQNFHIHEDNDDLYINIYLLNNEVIPNVIKKYIDNKINIISNYQGGAKNIYDNTMSQSNNITNNTNNNTNKNNLLHFINFLI